VDLDKSIEVVKKLKLVGTPLKIYKNTAFVKVSDFRNICVSYSNNQQPTVTIVQLRILESFIRSSLPYSQKGRQKI